jgi:vacuolar protein-sorting-associated protein 4
MSGSDITSVVRDALFEPVRKVQYATHFKHVMRPSRKDPTRITQHVMPCSPADPDAFEMTWTQIPLDAELAVPKVTFRDFIWALSKTKKSVGKEDVERQLKWMEDFGQVRITGSGFV